MKCRPLFLVVLAVTAMAGCNDETKHIKNDEYKSLYISSAEMTEWCGSSGVYESGVKTSTDTFTLEIVVPSLFGLSIAVCAIGCSLDLDLSSQNKLLIVFGVICVVAASAYGVSKGVISHRRDISKDVVPLITESGEYNALVESIDVLYQLRDAGNDVELKDRELVMTAMAATRKNLETAFRTERILRENPQFDPVLLSEQLGITVSPDIEAKADKYAKLLNGAIEIDRRVQNSIKDMVGSDNLDALKSREEKGEPADDSKTE